MYTEAQGVQINLKSKVKKIPNPNSNLLNNNKIV